MATPIIDSVSPASPITFTPGEQKTVTVVAHDPDAGATAQITLKVTDAAGNMTATNITGVVSDPLTYSADPAPAGWTVAGGGSSGVFTVKAP